MKTKSIIGSWCLMFLANPLFSQTLDDFNGKFFLGKWLMQTKGGLLVEQWSASSETIYKGSSYKIINSDTVLLETIRLESTKEGPVYAPVAKGQNNGKEVLFYFREGTAHGSDVKFVFENSKHDYPQRIKYHFANDTTLFVRIEGMVKGKLKFSEFNFRKQVD